MYKRTFPVIVILLGIMMLFPPLCTGREVRTGSSIMIMVDGIRDESLDLGGDGVLDCLELTVPVKVEQDGHYTIYGIIETINSNLINAHNASELGVGTQELVVRFPGWQIYESKQNGPYDIHIRITNSDVVASDFYTSGIHYYEDFNPTLDSPRLPIYNENLTLEFQSIMQTPSVTFYPTASRDEYQFLLTFETIEGWMDNGDGQFTPEDEVLLRGDLSEKMWDWSIKQEGDSLQMNIQNSIKLWRVEDMKEVGSVVIQFIFNTNIQGTYKKFDIDMTFSNSMEGINFITLSQKLEDVSANSDFNIIENGKFVRVQFVNSLEEELAYYEWINEADFYSSSPVRTINLTYSTAINDKTMSISLHYPYQSSGVRIFHDPVLGMGSTLLPGNRPAVGQESGIHHNLFVFSLTFSLGTLMVLYSIHRRRR